MEYKHDHHNVHLIVDPLIGYLRSRRKVLLGKGHDRLQQVIQEVAQEQHWSVIALALQPDHVPFVIRTTPNTLSTAMARLIKGRSAKTMREEFSCLEAAPFSLDPFSMIFHRWPYQQRNHCAVS